MWVFVENIGHKYDFKGVGRSLVGFGGWGGQFRSKEKRF